MSRPTRRSVLTAAAAAALLLTGCSDDGNSINEQARRGDQKGYISGDGTVEQIPAAQRQTVIELAGTTLEGKEWSSVEVRPSVLVINVWGSWCGPCQAEAPDLEQVWQDFHRAGDPVEFIGVNDRDGVPTALSFQREKGISYPSLADDGGQTLLALQGMALARPSTLVLDGQGRLAARVLGQVDAATLRGMVEDVLAS